MYILHIQQVHAIFDHTDDLKKLTTNQIVRMWLVHYSQFDTFQITMSECDKEVLHIRSLNWPLSTTLCT